MSLSRAIGLLIAAYLGLVVATAFSALSWRPLPDVPFLVALYAGLHCRPFASSGDGSSALLSLRNARPESMAGFGAVLGYLADVVEGSPAGLHALGLAVSVLLLRAVSIRLLVRGVGAVMLVALLSLIGYRLLLSLVYLLFSALFAAPGSTLAPLSDLSSLLGEAIVTAVVAPLVFAVLSRLDRHVWGDPRGTSSSSSASLSSGLGSPLGGGLGGGRRPRGSLSAGLRRTSLEVPA